MALYLNLYHEVQKQKLKRQRDPLKLAVMGLVVVAAGMVVCMRYFYRMERVRDIAQQQAGDVITELKKSNDDAEATAKQKELDAYDENIKLADAMIHKVENRFYWAPLLQQIVEVVPPDVQITALNGSVSSDGAKKVTLTVTGIATGSQPRAVAEELRIALQNKLSGQYTQPTAVFRSLEDGTEPVQYLGKSSQTALFVIDVTFTSPDVDEAAKNAAKPPVRHQKT